MTAQWPTKDDLAAARKRFEEAIPGWEPPVAFGVGLVGDDGTSFPVVNRRSGFLSAVVLGMVCGHASGTRTYDLPPYVLAEAVRLMSPAEACTDVRHPNLTAWRSILAEIEGAEGHDETEGTGRRAVAVFVGDFADPPADEHDARFRALLAAGES
ncbi:hypothetical protein O4J56_25320 [Nocardiopsis sp. RSe5-2]|uniref:Uncharacterized protein n=1 Tax=Nocardiopsis endophytica TaxID=3018445 RepID=A0ABT4UAL5_9ACTN|nr:hypothetical protein [Nocardiopsis endophytica]MDA2813991.1 hypothetical protein [Nocardiopsis endophytica]